MTTCQSNFAKASKAISALIKPIYFSDLPLKQIKQILLDCGFNIDNLNGVYCGHSGRVHEQISEKNYITLVWYKMESGKYEITCYLS